MWHSTFLDDDLWGARRTFYPLVPFLLGRDLFVMKGNQVLADKLTFKKKKSLFKDSAFVNRIAKFCSFKLILSAGIAGELSLMIKDEGCPDDALLLHLPVKSLISYTWVASNPLFALCTTGSKSNKVFLLHVPQKFPCAIKWYALPQDLLEYKVGCCSQMDLLVLMQHS